jgi:hypothetical protein
MWYACVVHGVSWTQRVGVLLTGNVTGYAEAVTGLQPHVCCPRCPAMHMLPLLAGPALLCYHMLAQLGPAMSL